MLLLVEYDVPILGWIRRNTWCEWYHGMLLAHHTSVGVVWGDGFYVMIMSYDILIILWVYVVGLMKVIWKFTIDNIKVIYCTMYFLRVAWGKGVKIKNKVMYGMYWMCLKCNKLLYVLLGMEYRCLMIYEVYILPIV